MLISKDIFRTGLLEIDGDPEVLVHGKGMSVIGYLLSVYVQCRFKIRCMISLQLPCRKPAGNCVWRFGFKHRLRKVFGSSAAIIMLEMMRMKNLRRH